MSDTLRVGIAGYGVVGERRRRFIDAHPRLTTVAVCDQKFPQPGTLPDGVKTYTNYKELLKERLDILFVCMPNYLAPEVTIAGLERGMHVFCEKPPGCTVKDIEEVCEAEARNPKLLLKYGFNHRYHDSVRDALALMKTGQFGKVVNARGVYGKSKIIPFAGGWRANRAQSGGGILLDQGIHMVDLMRLFCGELYEVKSFVSSGYWNHDVEDNAYALMRFSESGCAMLHSSATQWEHRFALDITMENGYLELRGILSGSKSYGQEQLVVGRRDEADAGNQREEVITYLEDNSWRDEVHEFAESVLDGTPVVSGSSRDALETMKTVYRIYWADEDWRNKYNIENPDTGR